MAGEAILEGGSLWRNVIVGKYGTINKWESKKVTGAHGVSLWKGISSQQGFFRQAIAMDIGRGNDTLFWHDRWCCPWPLREEVPRLFSLANDKQALVANCWNGGLNPNGWNIPFRHPLHDWEMDQMIGLIDLVVHSLPCAEREDHCLLLPGKNENFSVKSSVGLITRTEDSGFNWVDIWKIKAPCKVLFCVDYY